MAKKKKKTKTAAKPFKDDSGATPEAAPVASPVEESPKPAPAAAKTSGKANAGFPPFKGGGPNDFMNWKRAKESWEADNG